MKLSDRLHSALLRWDRILALLALALPFLVSMLAGIAWMAEHGWLLAFISGCIALSGGVGMFRLGATWWRRRQDKKTSETTPPAKLNARVDPEWTDNERRAFETAVSFIEERLADPLPWEELQPLAMEVIRRVAKSSGKGGRALLDFTVPEALLLIDQISVRFRSDIRRHLPFADSISVGTLHWLWRHRDLARRLKSHGMTAWRVFRAVQSLPIAILREIEGAIAEGHTSFATKEGIAVIQSLLLEEVAAAAVDLYSGRLRFSDAELLDLRLSSAEEDFAQLASPDMPLRIAIAGQVSAGKSSLINALLGEHLAETDVVQTTEKSQTYPAEFGDLSVVLLDTPGLDGSEKVSAKVLKELWSADMVLWTIRANRPAREIDRAAIQAFRNHYAEDTDRRMPPMIVIISCVDELLPGWPFAENFLDDTAMLKVQELVAAVSNDINGQDMYPVPVVLTEPEWNVSTLRTRIVGHALEALNAQRNRLRLGARKGALRHEAARARRGLTRGLTIFAGRD